MSTPDPSNKLTVTVLSARPPWSYPVPDQGSARPEHLTDRVWDWFTTYEFGRSARRPESKESLAKLVNEAFAASLQEEEGRPVRLQLLVAHHENQMTARFEHPIDYSASALVKLAPTIGVGFRWLIIAPTQSGDDGLEIVGICDPELSPAANDPKRSLGGGLSSHQPYPIGMKLTVLGPGFVRIEADSDYFELRNCSIRSPHSVENIRSVREWYKEVADGFDFLEMPVDNGVVMEPKVVRDIGRVTNATGLVRRTLASILGKVSYARHGGTILVIPKDADVSDLIRMKYSLPTEVLRASIEKRASYEPGLSNQLYRNNMNGSDVDRAHFSERDLARTSDLLASFTAIDGAVILRRDLTLLGYGAEILEVDPPSAEDVVEYVAYGEYRGVKRLIDFGMRHRSACRFCQKVEQAIAFVVSQDGDLRVFINEGGKVRLYEGATPESWVQSPTVQTGEYN